MSDLKELIDAARLARANAHSPYSRFSVGAALRTDDGRLFSGANVENASYPEGICAETAAIAAMVSAGGRHIAEIVVLAGGKATCVPCGGCRQRLREFATETTPIHLCGIEGHRQTVTLGELLPMGFGAGHLPS